MNTSPDLILPFALYDGFSKDAFGGSQAGIVLDGHKIDGPQRLKIAREFGWPATCFVTGQGEGWVGVRFCSTIGEYTMCGHGTVCLMTMLLERGQLRWEGRNQIDIELRVGDLVTNVEIHRRIDNRAQVLLNIAPMRFRHDQFDLSGLANSLGIDKQDIVVDLPLETIIGNFNHLVVAMKDLDAMGRIDPDFEELARFCRKYDLSTIAAFCTQTLNPLHTIHVRDFCPAVGVPESAAAGTTNAALANYLLRHGLVEGTKTATKIDIVAEQGIEIGRPSVIHTVVALKNGSIIRLQVGGVATKVLDGQLQL